MQLAITRWRTFFLIFFFCPSFFPCFLIHLFIHLSFLSFFTNTSLPALFTRVNLNIKGTSTQANTKWLIKIQLVIYFNILSTALGHLRTIKLSLVNVKLQAVQRWLIFSPYILHVYMCIFLFFWDWILNQAWDHTRLETFNRLQPYLTSVPNVNIVSDLSLHQTWNL